VKRVFPARGCRDILIAVTDGLKGMSEALAAVFPETTLQTCIVHLIRQSLDFATWKERKPLATALRTIYGAPSAEAAGAALTHEIPDTPEARTLLRKQTAGQRGGGPRYRAAWIERRSVHKCHYIPTALVKPSVSRSMWPAAGRRPTAGQKLCSL